MIFIFYRNQRRTAPTFFYMNDIKQMRIAT